MKVSYLVRRMIGLKHIQLIELCRFSIVATKSILIVISYVLYNFVYMPAAQAFMSRKNSFEMTFHVKTNSDNRQGARNYGTIFEGVSQYLRWLLVKTRWL